MATGPTTGASEPEGGYWRASPGLAVAVRALVLLAPLLGAYFCVHAVSGHLWRPDGWTGLVLWMAQAVVIGAAASMVIDRQTRRLLPLATLFGMSLVFPDRAPSRFSVALRSGTVRQLKRHVAEANERGLGEDPNTAAARALELVTALSHHDRFTRGHTERVRAFAAVIGIELGLGAQDRAMLSWGVLLHDVGKLAVPFEILNKVEPLSDVEWAVLQGHPAAGAELLQPLASWLGDWGRAAGEHHERWDGAGYPLGLAGSEISLAGRITAVADAFDVITSRRSYKQPLSSVAARRELVDCAGRQFDPEVVRALLNVSLGRRWVFGPLASLADISWGVAGAGATTPVVAAVGALAAIGAFATAPVVDNGPPTGVAFAEASTADTPVRQSTTVPVAGSVGEPSPATPGDPMLTVPPRRSEPVAPTTPTTEPVTLTATAPPVAPPTATVAPAPAPTAPPGVTTAATSAPATTAPATTTTTAPATTTTTAPATTTTTAPATTTTTTAPPASHYLSNVALGTLIQLDAATPGAGGLPDYDLPVDGVAGLALGPADEGAAERDLGQVAGWGLDMGGQNLDGNAQLTLWVATATDLGGGTLDVRAWLSDCNAANFLGCPTPFASAATTTNTWVGPGGDTFSEVVLDFGAVDHNFSTSRFLVLSVVVEGATGAHLAYGVTSYPSRIQLPIP